MCQLILAFSGPARSLLCPGSSQLLQGPTSHMCGRSVVVSAGHSGHGFYTSRLIQNLGQMKNSSKSTRCIRLSILDLVMSGQFLGLVRNLKSAQVSQVRALFKVVLRVAIADLKDIDHLVVPQTDFTKIKQIEPVQFAAAQTLLTSSFRWSAKIQTKNYCT